MNQPQNPVPPRGARPQLFKEPSAKSAASRSKHHADFGPSILATIDGKQARFATPRDHVSAKRVMLMGVVALVIAAVYVGVKFNASRQAAVRDAAPVASALPVAAPVVMKVTEVAASAPLATVAQGAAAIETVAQPVVPASAQTASSAPNVAASLNNIQLALNISEPAPANPAKRDVNAAGKEPAVTYRGAAPVSSNTNKPAAKAAPAPDTAADAELLAAMLPHLKRSTPAPPSPDYEKRCGKMSGGAAQDCRAKFCNGREGADAACPVAAPAQR